MEHSNQVSVSRINEIETVVVKNKSDMYSVIKRGRAWANEMGFSPLDQTRWETIITELVRSALARCGEGTITFQPVERNGASKKDGRPGNKSAQRGMQVTVEDLGPALADLAQALASEAPSAPSQESVLGISSVRQLADECAVDSAVGRGTRVRVCKWVYGATSA